MTGLVYFLTFPIGLALLYSVAGAGGTVTAWGGAACGFLFGCSIFAFCAGHKWLKGYWPHQTG